ncbi:DUF4374 domain-containing protein [Sphingobacterium sp. SGG-5]|uniref:DUF4374 domain-containing protein n=1 Tax=Sphingobacterium sp. SGG-5 TaxID=2710881 RepID=UPI0013EDAB08|nr:DUF4374 domain-containing protein [Sphingobacterium sp. SGG-5]NGM60852.1 DUF4374 domain-containing protein [Sphingobacterium sp. SGG-5]
MNIKNAILTIATAAMFVSCGKDDPAPANPGNFIIAVTPAASTGVADYLLTASSLDGGTISTQGQGVEQDGTYRYYLTHNNKFFSMLYGQGNPGAVTVYNIQNGQLTKLANTVTETVQAFTPVNDHILMTKISRNATNPTATWYTFNTNSMQVDGNGSLNTSEIAPGDEIAHFSWIKQVGNKVFAPFFSIKACCDAGFGTAYPDQAWIAVYSYPAMTLDKVIEDDRTSFIGRYFTDGMEEVENGDIYCFSASVATENGKDATLNSTKPSAVTRIKAGTTEFDSYYFDFEAASGGLNITDWLYVGDNNFVVLSDKKADKGAYNTGKTIGIINVIDETYKKVTGMPIESDIESLTGMSNYSERDGKGYIGVNLTSGVGYIYKIDATTATATQGLKVEGGTITAIEHLD